MVPFLVLSITLILVYEFGYICLVTPLVFIILVWLQYRGSAWCMKYVFANRAKIYDRLGTYLNETIKGIKSIKFNGWEDLCLEKIMGYRTAAHKLTRVYLFMHTFFTFVGSLFPPITTLIIIWYI